MNWKKLFSKKVLLILALHIVVVFGGLGVYTLLTPPTLQLTLYVAKESFQVGEPVNITITLQNYGLWPMTFEFSLYPTTMWFCVFDMGGNRIFGGPGGSIPGGPLPRFTLWPTQTITKTYTWDQIEKREGDWYQVPKDTYRIEAQTIIEYRGRGFWLMDELWITIE